MPRKKSTTKTADVEEATPGLEPSIEASAMPLHPPSDSPLSAEINHHVKTSGKTSTRKSPGRPVTKQKPAEPTLLDLPAAPTPDVQMEAADETALEIHADPDVPLPAELNHYITAIRTQKNGQHLDPLKLPLLDYRPAYLAPEEKVHVLLTGLHMFSEQNPLLDNIGCRIIRTVQYHLSSPLSHYIFNEGMRPQASGELLITSKRLVFNSVSSFLTVKWEELESIDAFANALRLNIRHLRHGLIFSMQDRTQIDEASVTLSHYLNQ